MNTIILFLSLVASSFAFQCYTCNNKPEDEDTAPCVESLETCAGDISSCSTVMFKSIDGKSHMRKFCTSPGTPIYQYLLFFPGSSLCQNVETAEVPQSGPAPPAVVPSSRADRLPHTIFAPAPPSSHLGNLLCVCTKDACNGGSFREVMERSMLQNIMSSKDMDNTADIPLQDLDSMPVL
uniref:Sodefrin-like factor n=1 Tax=Plectus sambesii TaxID=2011161 RepID=A0A914V5W4_9BILA